MHTHSVLAVLSLFTLSVQALDLNQYPDIELNAQTEGVVWVAPVEEDQAVPVDGSFARPYRRIMDAVEAANGRVLVLREGIYRESVLVRGKQVAGIIAYPGERATISGSKPVTGWTLWKDHIYTATIEHAPDRLTIDQIPLEKARYPDSGWVSVSANGEDYLVAPDLGDIQFTLSQTRAYVWTKYGNQFHEIELTSYDPVEHRLDVRVTNQWQKFSPDDKLYLYNNAAFLNQPGEWTCTTSEDGRAQLYVYVDDPQILEQIEYPDPKQSHVFAGVFLDGFTLAGIDAVGSVSEGIEIAQKSRDVTLLNNRAYGNNLGILLRELDGAMVKNNIAALNFNTGISLHTVSNATVTENEIAMNFVDGLTITWNTHDVDVSRNYIHHHLFWGHPDNLQLYRNVSRVNFTENFLLCSGQGMMTEEATDLTFSGNTVVGTDGNMLVFGHQNSSKWRVKGNTLAFTGAATMNITGVDYVVSDNIFVTGHSKPLFGTKKESNYTGAHNLFWNAPGLEGRSVVVSTEDGWHTSLSAYQQASGQDIDSIYANPDFRNAPSFFTTISSQRLPECEAGRIILTANINAEVGDWIELNFDGLPRRITAVNADTIDFEPVLKERPLKSWLVSNWKNKRNFQLDLRVAINSPAMANGKQVIGSTIDIPLYQQGDFNGDGQRDIPPALPQLAKAISRFR